MDAALPTIGVIARCLGASIHQVRYVIETRRIKPAGRAGNARVFDDHAVNLIRAELLRITDRKRRDDLAVG